MGKPSPLWADETLKQEFITDKELELTEKAQEDFRISRINILREM